MIGAGNVRVVIRKQNKKKNNRKDKNNTKTYSVSFMDDRNVKVGINAVKKTRDASDDGINHQRKKGNEREDLGPTQLFRTLITLQD